MGGDCPPPSNNIMISSASHVEEHGDGRGVAVDLHHVVGDGLDLRPYPVPREVEPLASGMADDVLPVEGHLELLQDQVVRVLDVQELGEEGVQPVLVVDPGDPDVDGLAGADVREVHCLVEQGVRGVGEALLQGAAERLHHHVGGVVDEDVSLHGPGIAGPGSSRLRWVPEAPGRRRASRHRRFYCREAGNAGGDASGASPEYLAMGSGPCFRPTIYYIGR